MEGFAGDAVGFVGVGEGEVGFVLEFVAQGGERAVHLDVELVEGLFGGALGFGLRPVGVFVLAVKGAEEGDFVGLQAGEGVGRRGAGELGEGVVGEGEEVGGAGGVEVFAEAVGGAFGGALGVFVAGGDDDGVQGDDELLPCGEFVGGAGGAGAAFAGDFIDEAATAGDGLAEVGLAGPFAVGEGGEDVGVFVGGAEAVGGDGDGVEGVLGDDAGGFAFLFAGAGLG